PLEPGGQYLTGQQDAETRDAAESDRDGNGREIRYEFLPARHRPGLATTMQHGADNKRCPGDSGCYQSGLDRYRARSRKWVALPPQHQGAGDSTDKKTAHRSPERVQLLLQGFFDVDHVSIKTHCWRRTTS